MRLLFRSVLLPFAGLLLLAACSAPQAAPATTPKLPLTDCTLAGDLKARCGILEVPEDRANPAGRRIALNVAVIPAVSRAAQPDPLFLLAGGPGQAAVETFPGIFNAFEQINQERDLVLVDQRGTGESNPLRCRDPEDETIRDEAAVIAELKQCPARLNADLRFYTTEIAMQDLDEVRAALGYERINLYGVSYGTRAALTYLRLFPERVRALILDSVVSADFRLFLPASQDGQRALNLLFARCQADAACAETFPNLRAEFDEVLRRLEAAPVEINTANPVSGQPLAFTLTRDIFVSLIFNSLYAPEFVALLPLNIHTAYEKQDFTPLLAQASSLGGGLYDGMFYAVACAEDAPFITEQAALETASHVFGDRTRALRKVCAAWPRGSVSAAFREPVASDAPALLLSGEADPITPPEYADKVAQTLPNSQHIVAPGMGHGILLRGCVNRLANRFIVSGSVSDLDVSCIQTLEPPPFFVSPSGPKP